MDAVSYDYKYENNTDKFSVTSKENLSYEMHVPTRSSKITSVKVNGTEVTDYTVDNFVNVKTPVGNSAVVEVTYANDEIAKVETEAVGGKNSDYTVKSNGKITAISDPRLNYKYGRYRHRYNNSKIRRKVRTSYILCYSREKRYDRSVAC